MKHISGIISAIILLQYIGWVAAPVAKAGAVATSTPTPTHVLNRPQVIGGTPTQDVMSIGGYARILIKYSKNGVAKNGSCNGVLVDSEWVLTAAYCMYPEGSNLVNSPNNIKIELGCFIKLGGVCSETVPSLLWYGQKRQAQLTATQIVVPDALTFTNGMPNPAFGVALIRLGTPAQTGAGVSIWPIAQNTDSPTDWSLPYIVSYGNKGLVAPTSTRTATRTLTAAPITRTATRTLTAAPITRTATRTLTATPIPRPAGINTDELLVADVALVDESSCTLPNFSGATLWCTDASLTGNELCYGDTGAPLVSMVNGQVVVFGISLPKEQFGGLHNCVAGMQSAMVNVTVPDVRTWIATTIKSASPRGLVTELGGSARFGDIQLPSVSYDFFEDGSYAEQLTQIDISGVFPYGMRFGDGVEMTLSISQNGYIGWGAFNNTKDLFVSNAPRFDVFGSYRTELNDSMVDTNADAIIPTIGSQSSGSNRVWVSLDAENGVVTVTWDDLRSSVDYQYIGNTFQVQFRRENMDDVRVTYRYGLLQWTFFSYYDQTSTQKIQNMSVGVFCGIYRSSCADSVYIPAIKSGSASEVSTQLRKLITYEYVVRNGAVGTIAATRTATHTRTMTRTYTATRTHTATRTVAVSGMTTGVINIKAGAYHTVALKNDGTITAWGLNGSRQTTVPAGLRDVTAIAAGGYHTVALKNDGTVVAWGYNDFGQATVPAGLSGVTAIAAGVYHTLALKADGTVVAWGNNGSGQTNIPAGLTGVTAIAAGVSHSLALRNNGTVVAWGNNNFGQSNVPVGLTNVIAIAAGAYHTVALKGDGTIVAWGDNSHGQIVVPSNLTNVTAVAAGAYHTLIINGNGTVVAWGNNAAEQSSVPSTLTGVSMITAGIYHTVALKRDGTVVAWGDNSTNQLKIPIFPTYTPTRIATPSLVSITPGSTGISAISAGGYHTIALKNDATVAAWGFNGSGQTNIPVGLAGVTAIAAGARHTVVSKSDGTVVAWGNNDWGQSTVPSNLANVTTIAAGMYHTVALKNDGTVVVWGQNSYSQAVVPAGLTDVTAIAAGAYHTVALKNDGTVVAWGSNNYTQTTIPAGLTGVTAIAAGMYHTVALKNDGTVVAWGNYSYGQTTVPPGLTNVIAIASGAYNTVALKRDGTVVAWGQNVYGQTTVPAGLTGVRAIAAGMYNTVALKNDGSVIGWGDNSAGQLNIPAFPTYTPTRTSTSTPIPTSTATSTRTPNLLTTTTATPPATRTVTASQTASVTSSAISTASRTATVTRTVLNSPTATRTVIRAYNPIFIWTGTSASIPAGWRRVTELDGKFPRVVASDDAVLATGGSATHTHTSPPHIHTMKNHTHVTSYGGGINTSAINTDYGSNGTQSGHIHGAVITSNPIDVYVSSESVTYSAYSNNPPYYEVIFITKSDDIITSVPNGAIALSKTSLGALTLADGNNGTPNLQTRFLRGAAPGMDAGAVGGSSTNAHTIAHTHITSHDHSDQWSGPDSSSNPTRADESGKPDNTLTSHAHITYYDPATVNTVDTSSISTLETVLPPYTDFVIGQNKTGQALTQSNILALYTGPENDLPEGWVLYGKIGMLIRGANATGSTGGATMHTHGPSLHTHSPVSHNHTGSTSTVYGNNDNNNDKGARTSVRAHYHPVTVSNGGMELDGSYTTANAASNMPEYVNVYLIEFVGTTTQQYVQAHTTSSLGTELLQSTFAKGLYTQRGALLDESLVYTDCISYSAQTIGLTKNTAVFTQLWLRRNTPYTQTCCRIQHNRADIVWFLNHVHTGAFVDTPRRRDVPTSMLRITCLLSPQAAYMPGDRVGRYGAWI